MKKGARKEERTGKVNARVDFLSLSLSLFFTRERARSGRFKILTISSLKILTI